jgi:mRNA interferase MazF
MGSTRPEVAVPRWGEIWEVDFGVPIGHEQGKRRPALVVSSDWFNRTRAELVVVCPLSTRLHEVGTHVRVDPPEGGLDTSSDVMIEHLRSVASERLVSDTPRGTLEAVTMEDVVKRLKVLMLLGRRGV